MPKPISLETFVAAHESKDGSGFVEAARLIAGQNPPRWLAKYLRNWSPSVMLDAAVHMKQPGRAEVIERLKALTGAAELVEREIHDPVVVKYLLRGSA
jgi:hypothetical protein